MKKFTVNITHASAAQLRTIAAELKLMIDAWKGFGPRITMNGKQVEKPQLRISHASYKPATASDKRRAAESYKRERGLK